jgi:hypothetical protein
MKNLTIVKQAPKDKVWKDEQGIQVPYNRTTKYERKAENLLSKMASQACQLHVQLSLFKGELRRIVEELYADFVEQNGGKIQGKGKGGITLYNFDRSIKVEVSINEPIRFDESYIKLAKAELDELLADAMEGAESWIRELIMSAFERSRGELDTDKVLSLKKHATRITDPRYHKAMEFIDKAINRPTSKEYFRVWVRDAAGQFQNIQLNFSNI